MYKTLYSRSRLVGYYMHQQKVLHQLISTITMHTYSPGTYDFEVMTAGADIF
jgi:hypothetical protein